MLYFCNQIFKKLTLLCTSYLFIETAKFILVKNIILFCDRLLIVLKIGHKKYYIYNYIALMLLRKKKMEKEVHSKKKRFRTTGLVSRQLLIYFSQ